MSGRAVHVKLRSRLAMLLVVTLLWGCAAQTAYREGNELVAQDRVEEGLLKYQEAYREDPANLKYRTAWLQARDRAVGSYIDQADRLAGNGQVERARLFYQRAISMDASSDRARAGLRALDAQGRHAGVVKDAEAALGRNDIAAARQKLTAVLAENPEQASARALMDKLARNDTATAAAPETALAKAYSKPITLEFRDVPLKQLFEVISRASGLNFLFDKDVKTDLKTSIFLRNSTTEAAVYYTLLTNQLEQQVIDGNTILIYPNTLAKQKDYQQTEIRTFYLNNADAKSLSNTIKTVLRSRDVAIDEKLNLMIMRDTPEAIRLAEKLVALHDVAEPEVMLEVEILEVKRTRLQELGVKWPDSIGLAPLPSVSGGTLTLNDLKGLNSNTIGVAVGGVTLNARRLDTDANILANPRIRARNHEKAKILIGERVPNITTTSSATGFIGESITYVDVGLKLDVEPTIYLNNDVAIKVALEVSNIVSQLTTKSGSVAYQIGTRTVSTVLRLKDGENQVLAGLINDEDRRTANKVPGLGQVPVIGRLFGSTLDDGQKTEIVLSITPRVVRNIDRADAAWSHFRSGTESSLRQRPGGGGGAIAAPASVSAGGPANARQPAPPDAEAGAAPPADAAGATGASDTPATDGSVPPASDPGAGIGVGAPAAPAALQWRGPAQSRVGSNFTVQLSMQSEEPISSVPLVVGFDSQALSVTKVSEGEFLKQGGATTEFTSEIDSKGQVLINATRSATAGGGASVPGTVATITFRALAPSASTAIELLSVAPLNATGGTVMTAVPAPYALKVLGR